MNAAAEASKSLWMADGLPDAPSLAGDIHADVVIVGAGIAGLSCAYEFTRLGRQVVVLDQGPLCGGMSARTSAHLSYEIDDYYHDLIRLRGEAEARQYFESQRAAVDRIEAIALAEDIACDFARIDGCLFAPSPEGNDLIRRELEAARAVGLDDVELLGSLPDHGTGHALRFPRQARFHPLKYLKGLVGALRRDGAGLYANSRVLSTRESDDGVTVTTEAGSSVRAAVAVIATNSPINDLIAIHTKQAPYRTYVFAAPVAKGQVPDALIWDTEEPYHYVRLQPREGDDLLIVGGEDHKSGMAQDGAGRIANLRGWADRMFGPLGETEFAWSGQVYEPVDAVPFIGRNPGNRAVYVVTGDSGEGLTTGVSASLIIPALVERGEAPWAPVYDPARKTLRALGEFVKENAGVAADMAEHVTPGEKGALSEIAPGEGALVRLKGHKVAAYRDSNGLTHLVSASCTHAGCVVHFNPFERCWDCPCHGSQFDIDGKVLAGPATRPLPPVRG